MTSRASRLVLALTVLTAFLGAQSSAALFDAPVVVGDDYMRFMNVLDFDGDGWKDALSVWYHIGNVTSVDVRGFRNDQTGRLVHVWTVGQGLNGVTVPLSQVDTATGDMNLDGQEDFVLSVLGTIYVYLSNGAQPPTLWVTTFVGVTPPSEIKMADFNGDGRADIVTLSVGTVSLLLTQPSGLPFPTSTQVLPAGTSHRLFLAEVNGDGIMDVGVAGASTGTQLRLYPVVGGILQPPLAFTLAGETMPMPVAGDVDNDGDQDVVVFGMSQYRILRRTGPATFNLESYVPGGPATGLADVDQDGDLDGVCCGSGGGPGDSPPNYYPSNYEISINNGGVFAPAFQITGLGSTRLAGAVDLDADGDLELVAGRCVYYPDGPITKSPFTAIPTTNTARSVIDVDQDGDPDLQGLAGTAIAFSRNTGDGAFASTPLLLPAPPAGSVWVGPGWPGDWDGDGDADLVVVQQTTGGAFMAMRILRNNSGGGYTDGGNAAGAGVDMRVMPATPVLVPMSPDAILAADIDLDGDLDLVCRAPPTHSRMWLNSGTGFFFAGQELPGNYVVAVAPIDANATPDFLAVYGSLSTGVGPLRLWRGLGGGAVAEPDAVLITSYSTWLGDCALADLDGDGDLDLATTTSNTTYVGQNDGNGNFSPPSPPFIQPVEFFYSAPAPQYVAILDVDADGYSDIVVGPTKNTAYGATAIHRGTATPWVYQPAIVQIFIAGALTDVDGDGDPDALWNKLARNRHFRQPDCGTRRQYGIGLAGSGGMVPVLGAVGPFRAGVSGDTRIRGGLGGAHALFGIGFNETATPILGGTLYTDPLAIFELDLLGQPGVPGAGWLNLPWTMPASLVGTAIYQQVAIIDPGAPQGATLTNGLHLLAGP
jgi:FG-GAP-like repeat